MLDTHSLCFDTEIIELLKERGILLYQRLWGIADDWGGYEPKYKDISLLMGAFKFKPTEVEKYINKLIEAKKIIPYQFEGKTYHWIANLLKHQPLNNPSPPKLPLPEWITCEIKEYPSGKKYGSYQVITSRLPVGYPSISNSNRTVTEQNGNSNRADITSFFSYFALKTKKDLKFNKAAADLINKRLKDGFSIEQLKKAVDNFIQDDWPERNKHLDLIYCIGKQQGKPDNLEKWINYKPKSEPSKMNKL